jgi:GxxExxY protein
MEEYKHSDLTHKIIGCAMQVHSFLGNGFQELIYQRALAIEFAKAGLNYQRELEVDIYYKDVLEPIGTRRVDFLVEGTVLKSAGQFRRCTSCPNFKLFTCL